MNFFQKIVIPFSIIILLFVGILFVFFRLFSQSVISFSFEHLNSVATLKAETVNNFLFDIEERLIFIEQLQPLHTFLESPCVQEASSNDETLPECPGFSEYIKTIKDIPKINEIIIYNKDTVPVLSSTQDEGVLTTFRQIINPGSVRKSTVQLPLKMYRSQRYNQIYFTEMFEFQDRPTMFGVLVLYNQEGDIIGSIFVDLATEQINQILTERTGLRSTGETYLVSPDKIMLTDSRFSESSSRFSQIVNTVDVNTCFQVKQDPNEGLVGPDYRGVSVLGTYKYIQSVDWCLLAKIDIAEISRIRTLTLKIIFLFGTVFLFGLLFFFEKISIATQSLQQKQHELRKTLAEKEKFETAVNEANDNISIVDPSLRVLYINQATAETTGYSVEESINKNLKELWMSNIPDEILQKLSTTAFIEKVPSVWELETRKKDGSVYPSEVSITPVIDDLGNILFALFIEHDISERKRVDAQKNEFIAITSHELRTPMSIVRGYVSLLLDEGPGRLTDEQKEILSRINVTSEVLINFVNDMLDISKLENDMGIRVMKEDVNLEQIVRDVARDFTQLAKEKKLDLRVNVTTSDSLIISDKLLIVRFLTNLLANAIKFTDRGEVGITILDAKNPDMIRIEVQDTGIGIPQEYRKIIFDKFSRVKNYLERGLEGGTGLGLPISKQIILLMGGTIDFTSNEKGTTFFVEIPRNK